MRFVVGAALAVLLGACYRPSYFDCTVHCSESCPSGYECRGDGFCHKPADEFDCPTQPIDASYDAPLDAATDAARDGGGTLTYLSIAAGAGHTCAVAVGGTLFCWGDNRNAEL